MAAEIRVDTIKGRSGINTFSFKGDGFSLIKKLVLELQLQVILLR